MKKLYVNFRESSLIKDPTNMKTQTKYTCYELEKTGYTAYSPDAHLALALETLNVIKENTKNKETKNIIEKTLNLIGGE